MFFSKILVSVAKDGLFPPCLKLIKFGFFYGTNGFPGANLPHLVQICQATLVLASSKKNIKSPKQALGIFFNPFAQIYHQKCDSINQLN